MSAKFEEYPKIMRHPGYRPARKIADAVVSQSGQMSQPEQWEPIRWPDVTVQTLDDEEYYASKGYKGSGDPVAFERAKASPHVDGRTHSEYPKMVNGVMVNDPASATSGIAEYPKWVKSPAGVTPVVEQLVDDPEQERAFLAKFESGEPVAAAPAPEHVPYIAESSARVACDADFALPKENDPPPRAPLSLKAKSHEKRA